ncbi:MAG: hypothetical protein O2992_04405 [Gemmatimonadetes bacterium]|jgi:prephenate dehydratase|nr:hypothetical protein [Gemmatimonadota bacterium]
MRPPPTIAFQGEHGAFSEAAALRIRPQGIPVPRRTFADVVASVESGEVDLGLLPVENTLAGGVVAAYDALAGGSVIAIAEVVIPIRLFVLGVPGADLSSVREIHSHPVALSQCGAFLAAHPQLSVVAVHDTAGAAKDVSAAADATVAAIAAHGAADRYGLEVLAEDVQDRPDNQTRFLLVQAATGRLDLSRSGSAAPDVQRQIPRFKTALVVETDNCPGALRNLLGPFARGGFDLAFIESRPTGFPWTYRFLVEFRHDARAQAETVANEVLAVARRVSVLGTFEAARANDD